MRTVYVPACTYRFGTDNNGNERFLDVRVHTYNVHREAYVQCMHGQIPKTNQSMSFHITY